MTSPFFINPYTSASEAPPRLLKEAANEHSLANPFIWRRTRSGWLYANARGETMGRVDMVIHRPGIVWWWWQTAESSGESLDLASARTSVESALALKPGTARRK